MTKSKRERGLCDVQKCYEKATVQWTTGGGTKLFVCEEHDRLARKEMGSEYFRMRPQKITQKPTP